MLDIWCSHKALQMSSDLKRTWRGGTAPRSSWVLTCACLTKAARTPGHCAQCSRYFPTFSSECLLQAQTSHHLSLSVQSSVAFRLITCSFTLVYVRTVFKCMHLKLVLLFCKHFSQTFSPMSLASFLRNQISTSRISFHLLNQLWSEFHTNWLHWNWAARYSHINILKNDCTCCASKLENTKHLTWTYVTQEAFSAFLLPHVFITFDLCCFCSFDWQPVWGTCAFITRANLIWFILSLPL